MSDLEPRLAALERSNRCWKWSTLLLSIAMVLVVAVAADKPVQVPDVIYARKFVAVNQRDEPVALLGHSENAGMVGVAAPDGTLLFVASATDKGHGIMSTYAEDGHHLVSLGADDAGAGRLTVYDQEGKAIAMEPVGRRVSATLRKKSR
jgi:hypothetical protein